MELWGAQTRLAVENFPVSGLSLDPAVVHALAMVKAAAARANEAAGVLDPATAAAIAAAADEVADGRWDDQFPVDVYQTGSGTSSNMNANEVIASLAAERLGRPVHPNDHVNASQSSNDVFPTAVRIGASLVVVGELLPAVDHLRAALGERAHAFADVVKAGRTHLMDATPVTLGQELDGYAAQLAGSAASVRRTVEERVVELPLGGTATGTGINAPHGFAADAVERLAERTGLPLREAADHFAVQGGQDALVELSGQLRVLAVVLTKVANDLRWMASGPATGLAELRLPALQAGSSIMPGKVNPVMPEMVAQVAVSVFGHDTAVAFAGSQGVLELHTYLPVMAHHLLAAARLLTAACRLFADRCVAGLEADPERCRTLAEHSAAVVTWLNPVIGYDRGAEVVAEAVRRRVPVRVVLQERGWLSDAELDALLDVRAMARGGMPPRSGPAGS
ncbi:MAG: class II fumarate hydratase [Acidimicrobiales bacterium]|nr:class II fumarate hydratase [Acidimicrobiales bacterium]